MHLKVQSVVFLGDDKDWYLSMMMTRRCGMDIKLSALRRTKHSEATDIPKGNWRFGDSDRENDSEHSDQVHYDWLLVIDLKSVRRFTLKEIYFP